MPTASYQVANADQRYAFGSLRVRWGCLHCSWVLCFSPASQDISQPIHKRSSSIDSPMHKELSDHLLAGKILNNLLQKAAGIEVKRLFPCYKLINTMQLSFGKPAVMWEGAFLSPGNDCLSGGLKCHGREKGNFKTSSNFIAHKMLSAHAVTV